MVFRAVGGSETIALPQARGSLLKILLQIISSGLDLEEFALYRGSWVTVLLLNVSLSLMSSGISFLTQDSSVSRLRFIAARGDIIPCLTL